MNDGKIGTDQTFTINVTNADDAITRTGTSGNNFFEDGNDTADLFKGGTGLDTAVFAGPHEDYIIVQQPDGTIEVTHGTVVDTLISIERLQFEDGTLAFDADGTAGQIFRLYRAAFDRTPDPEGLSYWIKALDAGKTDLKAIAESFIHSPEFERTYGTPETVSDAQFVNLLYLHTLGREAGSEGFDYWVDKLQTGQTDRADLLAFFSESDENVAHVEPDIQDGIWIM